MRFLPNALPRQRHTGKDGGDTANKAGSEIKRGEGVVPGLPALHDIKRESGKSRKAAAETGDTERQPRTLAQNVPDGKARAGRLRPSR